MITKEKIELKILDIIKKEKKDNLTLKLIKIFIRIFCDINITRENLIKDEEKLIKGTTLEMEDIYEIDGLWDVYFKMKSKELSEELKLFISKLYQDNKGEENLMKKCLKEIDDIKNSENKENKENNENRLEQVINMINYVISESENWAFVKQLKDIIEVLELKLKNSEEMEGILQNKVNQLTEALNKNEIVEEK